MSILLEKATLRQLITIAGEVTTDCFNAEMRRKSLTLRSRRFCDLRVVRIKNKFESVGQLLPRTFEEIEATQGEFQRITIGFKELDEMTTGLQKVTVILAARPSMGKTALALSIVLNAAIHGKRPSAIFSLEMSSISCSAYAVPEHVNMHQLRSGTLPKRDLPVESGRWPACRSTYTLTILLQYGAGTQSQGKASEGAEQS